MATKIKTITVTNDDQSGYIVEEAPGPTYTVVTGTAIIGQSPYTRPSPNYRSFLHFDTSIIPTNAKITKVELVHNVSLIVSGFPPDDWKTNILMGIATTTDPLNASDWSNGTFVLEKDWTTIPVSGTIDLGSTALNLINKNGYTDVMLHDNSNCSSPQTWNHVVYLSGKSACKLIVTYKIGSQVIKIN